jgi:uncharacterized protein (DUF1330 family)
MNLHDAQSLTMSGIVLLTAISQVQNDHIVSYSSKMRRLVSKFGGRTIKCDNHTCIGK